MNLYKHFDNYKNIIINEIIQELGIENKEYLKDIFHNLRIIFETAPREEYLYLKEHIDKNNLLEIFTKYREYINLEQAKKSIYSQKIRPLIDDWISFFINLNTNQSYDKIAKLFCNYHYQGILIDYFSSDYNTKLSSNNLSEGLKDYILNQRNNFQKQIKKYNYHLKEFDSKLVDVFIKWRDMYVKLLLIKYLLQENNPYISKIANMINDSDPEIISDIISAVNPKCIKYEKRNGQEYRFVYLPINRLKRYRNKTIDVILIHELIHLTQHLCLQENIINEILVQYKAIKIVEKLHNQGIYIFDEPSTAKSSGECLYEALFPFINKIIEYIPNELLNKAIIEDNYHQLEQVFGDNFSEYLIILDKLYQDLKNNIPFNIKTIQEYEKCVSQMLDYHFQHNREVKNRILTQ